MPGGADHGKPAEFHYRVVVVFVRPAEFNVGAPTGHLRGDGDPTNVPGFGDDSGFLRVVFRVEHVHVDVVFPQGLGQCFGFRHVLGADQHRLACVMDGFDFVDDGPVFIPDCGVHPVCFVEALQRLVPVDHADPQVVEAAELICGFYRGAGHAAHHGVSVHEGLQGDGVEDAAPLRHGQAFLGFHGGLYPIGPPLEVRHPAFGGVDKRHFTVPHDVVHVPGQERVRVQCQVDLH